MKLNVTTAVLFIVIHFTYSLNILGIYPYQGKSHFLVYRVLLQQLANRGHNLTVISHFPEKDPPKNYHDIILSSTTKAFEDNKLLMETTIFNSLRRVLSLLHSTGVENCEVMLANEKVQNIVREKQQFDVILMEQFNSDCGLGIAYKLGAPVVGTTSSTLMPYYFQRFGIPSNPSFVSNHFLGGGTKPTLIQRVQRYAVDCYGNAIHYFTQRINEKTLNKYFGDVLCLEDLGRDIKLVLVYQYFVFTGSKLLPANVIEVGGYHVANSQPLTGKLKKFVDEADDGIIYISFGSMIKISEMPFAKVEAILGAIEEFPQRVIWKSENKTISSNKKLYISNWLPQIDILGHPKTLAFVSHAGMGGTIEAVSFGVPMIAIPIYGDQPSNAAGIEESHFGVKLDYTDLTKENLVNALKKILDPKFRENAKRVTDAWHDRPMNPLDTAIFWTEFAARHHNLTFRSAAADVPLYKYYNVDIIGILVVVLSSILVVLGSSISLWCRKKTFVKSQSLKFKSKRQ